jgi:hypothetical protein
MKRLFYGWFVQYNPLYFFSAMCILAGVFLLSQEFDSDLYRQIFLLGVAQLYEVLLIGAAYYLIRFKSQRRPAVILGLLEIVFLLDGTMAAERLARPDAAMLAIALGMGVLGMIKLWMLARLFGLRNIGPALRVGSAVLVFLPLAPHLVEWAPSDSGRQAVHMALSWLGAALFAWSLVHDRKRWESDLVEGEWASTVLRRVAVVMPFLFAGLFVAHSIAWSLFLSIPLSPAHAAPFLLVIGAARPREFRIVVASAAAVACAALPPPMMDVGIQPVGIILLVSAAVLSSLRMTTPAILAAFAAMFAQGWNDSIWAACLFVALAIAARKSLAALIASGVVIAWQFFPYSAPCALILALIWIAALSWMLRPDWLPHVALGLLMILGAALVWRYEHYEYWYLGMTVLAATIGALRRDRWYLGAGALGASVLLAAYGSAWIPRTSSGWGTLVVIFGFVLLGGGFAINVAASRIR